MQRTSWLRSWTHSALCRHTGPARPRPIRRRGAPGLEPLEGRWAPAVFTVTNVNDTGPGSLEQAIQDANATPGRDTIAFDIPGPGVHRIVPVGPLPDIRDPVLIDGYTQPGARANTRAVGNDAVLLIEINGARAGSNADGLVITGGQTTIRGLVINGFRDTDASSADGNAIVLLNVAGNRDNVIEGNFIGTDATGTVAVPNEGNGVVLFGSAQARIGGDTPAARNLLSGNGGRGILLSSSNKNFIAGNYLGTNAAGTAALPNFDGIGMFNASANQVGGLAPGAGNLLAFHRNDGVFLTGGVQNTILGNAILANGGSGVVILSGTENLVVSNAIADNGGLGIDLAEDGVTPNDPGDADTGANNLQNFPVVTSAQSDGTITVLTGTLDSTANTAFRIELFGSSAADPSGFGEGETLLGVVNVTTDAAGNASFRLTLDTPLPLRSAVTATATNLGTRDTSEFSAAQIVESLDPPTVERVVINDGRAQRSMVTSVTVTFSEAVILDPGAFELRRQGGGLIGLVVNASVVNGKTVAVLTFTGADIVGGSLADGNYTLTVRSDKVRDAAGQALDGDNDRFAGGDRLDTFFRLFGDSDGDRDVDAIDHALFKTTKGLRAGEAGFLAFFDQDGDGDVDGRDNAQFARRLGTVLNP